MSRFDLTVLLPARDARLYTQRCLESLDFCLGLLPLTIEVVLIDDASEDPAILQLFHQFRAASPHHVRIFRLHQRGHYTGVFNLGLSQARGEKIFFLSNDMQVTPSFLDCLMGVMGADHTIASVRGRSAYTDSFPEHRLKAPLPLRDYHDILAFSAFVAGYHGLAWQEDRLFSGDAVLLSRQALSRVGGFDPQFFGYYSDFDWGLRAQREGLKLVCALGAWLHHEGAGHVKDESARGQLSWKVVSHQRDQLIQADYLKFRHKWNPALPHDHRGVVYDFDLLRSQTVDNFAPPSQPQAEEL